MIVVYRYRVKSLTGLLNGQRRLTVAQRANKMRLVRSLHAKVANTRRDFLHKLSTRIVQEFDYIAVGNVRAAGLAKTSMAKSVFDASWSSFRNMLAYKFLARFDLRSGHRSPAEGISALSGGEDVKIRWCRDRPPGAVSPMKDAAVSAASDARILPYGK